jgi:hypothetical protein
MGQSKNALAAGLQRPVETSDNQAPLLFKGHHLGRCDRESKLLKQPLAEPLILHREVKVITFVRHSDRKFEDMCCRRGPKRLKPLSLVPEECCLLMVASKRQTDVRVSPDSHRETWELSQELSDLLVIDRYAFDLVRFCSGYAWR